MTAALPTPAAERAGPIGWARRNLFASLRDGLLTISCIALLWVLAPPFLDWAIFSATWSGDGREACAGGGACWPFVGARLNQFIYGFYPAAQQWRVDVAFLSLAAGVVWLGVGGLPAKRQVATAVFLVWPPVCVWLLAGGLGLPVVQTREWGGLMLTGFMAIFGGLIAFPLGVALALGRQSSLPVVRTISITFIEFWRGVPIITVIFLASQLLPLILPDGVDVDKLLRALIGLALVVAAYMAETVRGGLQALAKGQYEAADALGLNYWQATRLIVLPQALRVSIPGLVNEFIALFKNTTLVLIVSLFDLLGIVQAALADPKWVGLTHEGYLFAGLVFWIVCFGLSRWSLRLEAKVGLGRR
jgi:general L-amino acid transport system permease protein